MPCYVIQPGNGFSHFTCSGVLHGAVWLLTAPDRTRHLQTAQGPYQGVTKHRTGRIGPKYNDILHWISSKCNKMQAEMHENCYLFLFLIEINNMHRPRHILPIPRTCIWRRCGVSWHRPYQAKNNLLFHFDDFFFFFFTDNAHSSELSNVCLLYTSPSPRD